MSLKAMVKHNLELIKPSAYILLSNCDSDIFREHN